MKKLKVFFEATPLIDTHISGVGKVLQETLRVLDTKEYADKYDMFVFVPFDEYAKARRALRYTYIKLKLLPFPHRVFSLLTRLRVSMPVDIFLGKGVYVFENFRNLPVVRSKSITYIHDISFMLYPDFVQEANLRYLKRNVATWVSRTDTVVTVSEASRREMLETSKFRSVETVTNAVNIDEYYPRAKQEVVQVRDRWKLPSDYCVFIGNIEPRKNLVNMVRGFTEFVRTQSCPMSLLIIGGGGWRNEEIMQEIEYARQQGVDIIRPHAYVPDSDLPAIISGARSLLQVSWHEGFGLPVLQSIACGVPVVASRIPALQEAAAKNEDLVTFCSPEDMQDIARAIQQSVVKKHKKKQPHVIAWSCSAKALTDIIDRLVS